METAFGLEVVNRSFSLTKNSSNLDRYLFYSVWINPPMIYANNMSSEYESTRKRVCHGYRVKQDRLPTFF
jgi:hypothetical protein